MNMFKRFSAFFIVALLAATLGCSSTKPQSTGEYVDDSWITTKVKTDMLNEPTLKVNQITVETYKGAVQLSGFVNSAANKDKAAEITRSVKGVTSVRNDLQLR
jgi:osmotically-inducible protein OsmY